MKKKITALFLCVSLLAIAVVGASLAYFTDTTDTKSNTFTMGGVDIDLTEPKWEGEANLMPGTDYAKDPTITVGDKSENSYVYLEMSLNKLHSLLWVMAADASADDSINFTIFNADGSLMDAYKNDSGAFSTTKCLAALQANKKVAQAIVNKWFKGINHADWEIVEPIAQDADNSAYYTLTLAYIGGEKDGVLSAEDEVTFMTSFGMPASVTSEMISSGKTVGGMKNNFNTDAADFVINFTAYAVQAEGFDSAAAAWEATFGA